MTDKQLIQPFLGSTFGFEVDGVPLAFFTGVSGINMEFAITENIAVNKDGKRVLTKIPGRPKYSEVVLKRGMSADKKLHDWFKQITDHAEAAQYKTAAIVCYNAEYTEVARFNLDQCWPSKLSGSDLSSGSDDVMIEELTIQHQELTWA